jgi:hypothetical protein
MSLVPANTGVAASNPHVIASAVRSVMERLPLVVAV